MTLKFYGPGFKTLENALKEYRRWIRFNDRALAINPNTNKWHIVIIY